MRIGVRSERVDLDICDCDPVILLVFLELHIRRSMAHSRGRDELGQRKQVWSVCFTNRESDANRRTHRFPLRHEKRPVASINASRRGSSAEYLVT